jgi:CPA2 family monovalent cation:H+ antiporter-2
MGWSLGAGLVFGLALSVASTVVLLRAIQERRLMETDRGRIAVGWLIVEDLAMVMALVLLPALAPLLGGNADAVSSYPIASYFNFGLVGILALTVVKVALFLVFMLVIGRRFIPWVLHWVAHTGSRELFRLSVLAIALSVAFGAAKLFGVSLALGAFFAGMILSESALSQRAAQESLPLRDAFAVLFFVSVGMLFNPATILADPWPLIATLLIILVVKSAAAYFIVRAFGHPVTTALTISASLAQIGEFSFILAELGLKLKLLPPEGRDLILAGAIISILLNPLIFFIVDRINQRAEADDSSDDDVVVTPAAPAAPPEAAAPAPGVAPPPVAKPAKAHAKTSLTGHTVLVGHGRVGGIVGDDLRTAGVPLVVIEASEDSASALHGVGVDVIIGNAAAADVLRAANVAQAAAVVIAIPEAFEAGQVVEQARQVNPGVRIIARAHSDAEVKHLSDLGADTVIMGEREIAHGMLDEFRAWRRSRESN